MRTLPRLLIVALLSLLLPLQGTLAYARSIAMAGKMMSEQSAAPAMTATSAHSHHGHHADSSSGMAVAASSHQDAQAVIKAPVAQPHKHASNACDNCAKCCLAGAAAPPSVNLSSVDVSPARIVYTRACASLSGFIPDGPERPPRYFLS